MSRASRAHPGNFSLAAIPALLSLWAASTPDPAPAAPPDALPNTEEVAHILHHAQRVQTLDVAAWSSFRFRRAWLREEYDDAGTVQSREHLVFQITPDRGGGFDELLLSHNGRPPTPKEVEEHRREARFSKHYLTMVRGDAQTSEGGYSLAHLLHMSSYRYAGRETYNGFPCHRLDFSPDEVNPKGGLSGKFASAMVGSLWISVDGHHLAGAHTWTVRPISIYLGLSKVHDLDIRMESRPGPDGFWLPRRIEVRSKVRILIRTAQRRSLYEYLDFESFRRDGPAPAGG